MNDELEKKHFLANESLTHVAWQLSALLSYMQYQIAPANRTSVSSTSPRLHPVQNFKHVINVINKFLNIRNTYLMTYVLKPTFNLSCQALSKVKAAQHYTGLLAACTNTGEWYSVS